MKVHNFRGGLTLTTYISAINIALTIAALNIQTQHNKLVCGMVVVLNLKTECEEFKTIHAIYVSGWI